MLYTCMSKAVKLMTLNLYLFCLIFVSFIIYYKHLLTGRNIDKKKIIVVIQMDKILQYLFLTD
jgi:hypothetical protein